MNDALVPASAGVNYEWANDHIYVKTPANLTQGRVTVVEDTLKPGFELPRHHHRQMVEIFYILEGSVTFEFDDGSVDVTPGITVNVEAGVWHRVSSQGGARLLTIFTPGGFDDYLDELASLGPGELEDAELMTELAERYDTWTK